MKKSIAVLASLIAFSSGASALTIKQQGYSRVVECNSSDTIDICRPHVDGYLMSALYRAHWKNSSFLEFKPGNIVAAYDGTQGYLGDFPITLIKVLSIDNRSSPYGGGYKTQGHVEFIAGGLYIKISTEELSVNRSTMVCINNDCHITRN